MFRSRYSRYRKYGSYKRKAYGSSYMKRGSYAKRRFAWKKKYSTKKGRTFNPGNMIHVKLFSIDTYTGPNNPPTNSFGNTLTYGLDFCTGSAVYKNMYKWYRINKVVTKFFPLANSRDQKDGLYSATLQFSTNSEMGFLGTTRMIDQEGAASGINNMRVDPTYREVTALQPHTRVLVPNCLARMYEAATSDGFVPKYKQWIRTLDDAVPHMGLKYWVSNPEAGLFSDSFVVPRWRVQTTYYVSFKELDPRNITESVPAVMPSTVATPDANVGDLELDDAESDEEDKDADVGPRRLKRSYTNVGLPPVAAVEYKRIPPSKEVVVAEVTRNPNPRVGSYESKRVHLPAPTVVNPKSPPPTPVIANSHM